MIHNNPQKDGGPTHIPTLRVAHHGSATQTTKLPYIFISPTPKPKPFISSTSPAKYLVNPTTTVSTLRPVHKREQRRPEVAYPIPPIPTFDPKSLFGGKFKIQILFSRRCIVRVGLVNDRVPN